MDYSKEAEEVFLKPIFGCRDEVLKHWIFSRVSHNNIEEDSDSNKLTYYKSLAPPQIPSPKFDPSTMEVYVVKILFPNYANNFYFSVPGPPPIILGFQLFILRFLISKFCFTIIISLWINLCCFSFCCPNFYVFFICHATQKFSKPLSNTLKNENQIQIKIKPICMGI